MVVLHAPAARLPGGWASNVRLEIGTGGEILSLSPDAAKAGAIALPGPIVPGMPNLHSHAFQRAMAGLAEIRSPSGDDFWSWREAMYRFLAVLTPCDVEAIATQLYIEMLKAGYTRVCEFHYLHNDVDGRPYADPSEMARAHLRAAETAGIGITLIPVLYTSSGCGGKPLKATQARFRIAPPALIEMVHALEDSVKGKPDANVAVSLHSLRAARMEEIAAVVEALPGLPLHIHASEQRGEVEECVAWCGRTPVAQLQHTIGLDSRWHLVHATHITPEEIEIIADAGATPVLCPTTEGNLGDGFFPADAYFAKAQRFGIGTDSHVTIDPREELRWFEYGRRLKTEHRALSATDAVPHTGAWLWTTAAAGGRNACGANLGSLEVGARADFLVLDTESPSLMDREQDTLLDAFVFASLPDPPIAEVWVGGQKKVAGCRHTHDKEARDAYRRALTRMKG